MGQLEKGRVSWYDKPIVHQTWVNFKTHFSDHWNKLRKLRGPSMRDTLFQKNINLIKTEVVEAIKQERMAMVQEVSDSYSSILQALSAVPYPTIDQDDDTHPTAASTLTESAYSMDEKNIQQEMLKILIKLDKKLDESLENNHRGNKQSRGPRNNTGKNKRFQDNKKHQDQDEKG